MPTQPKKKPTRLNSQLVVNPASDEEFHDVSDNDDDTAPKSKRKETPDPVIIVTDETTIKLEYQSRFAALTKLYTNREQAQHHIEILTISISTGRINFRTNP